MISFSAIIYPDSGKFIAQCLEHDVCAQADTADEAIRLLEITMDCEAALGGDLPSRPPPRAICAIAPPYFITGFSRVTDERF